MSLIYSGMYFNPGNCSWTRLRVRLLDSKYSKQSE